MSIQYVTREFWSQKHNKKFITKEHHKILTNPDFAEASDWDLYDKHRVGEKQGGILCVCEHMEGIFEDDVLGIVANDPQETYINAMIEKCPEKLIEVDFHVEGEDYIEFYERSWGYYSGRNKRNKKK